MKNLTIIIIFFSMILNSTFASELSNSVHFCFIQKSIIGFTADLRQQNVHLDSIKIHYYKDGSIQFDHCERYPKLSCEPYVFFEKKVTQKEIEDFLLQSSITFYDAILIYAGFYSAFITGQLLFEKILEKKLFQSNKLNRLFYQNRFSYLNRLLQGSGILVGINILTLLALGGFALDMDLRERLNILVYDLQQFQDFFNQEKTTQFPGNASGCQAFMFGAPHITLRVIERLHDSLYIQ